MQYFFLQDNIYVLNATCDKVANEGSFTCMTEGRVSDQTLDFELCMMLGAHPQRMYDKYTVFYFFIFNSNLNRMFYKQVMKTDQTPRSVAPGLQGLHMFHKTIGR